MKKQAIFLLIFLLASVLELVLPNTMGLSIHFITKPLIVTSLIFYYLAITGERQSIFIAALMACLTGDIFLLMEKLNQTFFLLGLVAFLAAHILFLISYRKQRHVLAADHDRIVNVQKARLSFPVIMAGTGLVIFLYPALGPLKFPVMIYSLVLVIMVLSSASRLGRTSPKSFWMVYTGAILFMTSDSILAINKFSNPIPFENLLVMGSYCTAQFLIVKGMTLHK